MSYRDFPFDIGASLSARAVLGFCLITLVAVFAADGLASLVGRGALPRVTVQWPDSEEARLAQGRPNAKPGRAVTVYRSIGVDMETTSTIPTKSDGVGYVKLAPCGEKQ